MIKPNNIQLMDHTTCSLNFILNPSNYILTSSVSPETGVTMHSEIIV